MSPKYISTNKYEIKNEIIPSRFKKNEEYMANEITGVKFGRCGRTLEKNIIDKISLEEAVSNRDSYGGTSPENIKKEIIFSKEKWCND